MGDFIQAIPRRRSSYDRMAEEAGTLQTPLSDAFERWNSAFLTGSKSREGLDAYVKEMKSPWHREVHELYNANL